MAQASKIEWTGDVWNPVTGCTPVSAGCKNCYAKTFYERFNGRGSFVNVTCHEDRLLQPLKWRKPRLVFVNSMGDLFHPNVKFEFVDKVFAVMALTPQHTYQILTKYPKNMHTYFAFSKPYLIQQWEDAVYKLSISGKDDDIDKTATDLYNYCDVNYPLPNVWLGTSVENQEVAKERIPYLQDVPAAVRFLSCEPLLSGVNITEALGKDKWPVKGFSTDKDKRIHWVIAGGESGIKARPVHPKWIDFLRTQCKIAKVPFFFKQWGAFAPGSHHTAVKATNHYIVLKNGEHGKYHSNDLTKKHGGNWQNMDAIVMRKVGKKNAGRNLNGKEYNQMPR